MREEEYLWSYKFSGASKEYSWCPYDPADQDDAADPSVKPGNLLLLKSMVLMPSAKADEESVVQVESEVYNNCKVCFCIVLEGDKSTVIINLSVKVVTSIVAMRGREDYQKFVNILIPHNYIQADPA